MITLRRFVNNTQKCNRQQMVGFEAFQLKENNSRFPIIKVNVKSETSNFTITN